MHKRSVRISSARLSSTPRQNSITLTGKMKTEGSTPASGVVYSALAGNSAGTITDSPYTNASNLMPAPSSAWAHKTAREARALPDPFFDGRKAGRLVAIGPINLPVGLLFVEEVITECRKRGASRADILAFEFEMGLFPAVPDEAKRKGIDIAPKIIPPEVFDKRAVDKGQVRFSDVTYVESNPRYVAKDKNGRASAPARTAAWNSTPPRTPMPSRADTPSL